MEFAAKPIQYYLYHLRHVSTLLWEIKKIQIFCRYSASMEQIANKLHYNHVQLCYSSTKIDIFGVFNSESFHILTASKIFRVIVFLLNYFCNQLVAPDIRHSLQQTSLQCLSTNSMVFSDEMKILKKFVFEGIHSGGWQTNFLKWRFLKMQFSLFSSILDEYRWISAENLNF